MPEPKKLDIAEFQQLGLLQEVNRRFFHPIGLALAIEVPTAEDTTPKYCPYCGSNLGLWGHDDNCANKDYKFCPFSLAYIIDSRDDPEGFIFCKVNPVEAATRAHYYDMEVADRHRAREKLFQRARPDFVRLQPDGVQPVSTMNMTVPDKGDQ